ncbi:Afh1, related, related [Eimeria mitis]|uniref:Afh1, related, related n=1 Tax=Eimeria mitis TaxID=44415 RepID=U6KDY1_9EIME|nr:Afh1, related, related [Eimeria mitis]CDJ33688.1 Afh1, related, related [Eimeria mitis]
MEFRSTVDSRLSSLHYILVNLMASLPDLQLERLPEEMPLVEKAARLTDEALDAAAALLQRETQFLLQQIQQQGRPQGGPWGTQELERLRRLHGETVLGFERVRQRYAASKEKVMQLARFYGEEPQRLSAAAAAAAAAAAGEGWGGLMHASPFSTLAAILLTFKQTLRDIQQHPKRYAVLLANTGSSSNSNSKSSSSAGSGKDGSSKNTRSDAAAASAAAANEEGESAATADMADAAKRTPAAAAAGGRGLQSRLLRKCSSPDPIPFTASATAAAASGALKAERGQRVSGLSPPHHQERLQLPRRSSSCFDLDSSLQQRPIPQQQQHQQAQPAVAAEQQGQSGVQQPHQHAAAVAVRLPAGSRVPGAGEKGIECFRGPAAAAAAATAATAAAGNRATLHALIDEPSFPALDVAASINRALFVQTETPATAAAAASRPEVAGGEAHQERSVTEETPPCSAAAASEQQGKHSQQQRQQQLLLQQQAPSSVREPFFPPRVVPRRWKQQQQQEGAIPRMKVPLLLRPRLPPPAFVRGEHRRVPRIEGKFGQQQRQQQQPQAEQQQQQEAEQQQQQQQQPPGV